MKNVRDTVRLTFEGKSEQIRSTINQKLTSRKVGKAKRRRLYVKRELMPKYEKVQENHTCSAQTNACASRSSRG